MIERADREFAALSQDMEGRAPWDILAWAAKRFAGRVTLATGFGVEGCALIDMIARHGLDVDLFTLDTGLLFPETYLLWRRLEARYGVRVRAVRPERTVEQQATDHGPLLWERDPDRCCELRKLVPLREALRGFDAWVSAIRRDQTPTRARTPIVARDPRLGLAKISPLAAWRKEQVWDYVRGNDVPHSELHYRGYPSIGCQPCTTPVRPGEDPRAGRWRAKEKTECGLHLPVVVGGVPARDGGREPMETFPTFLKLEGRAVLVVGGGPVAAGKIDALLRVGARVQVVAPEVRPEIQRPGVTIHRRPFAPSDLEGVWFVVAAAPREVNRGVTEAAERRQLFVNAVDDSRSATAYAGGVVRRRGVTVAVSTDGRAPALSGLVREALQDLLPADLERWAETARDLRRDWKRRRTPMKKRRPLLLEALNRIYAEDPS